MDALDRDSFPLATRRAGVAERAVQSTLLAAALVGLSIGGIWLLSLAVSDRAAQAFSLWAFAAVSLLLAFVSLAMHRAVGAVRRERQRQFRRWLAAAIAGGVAFTIVQSVGFRGLLPPDRVVLNMAAGPDALLMAIIAVHALHVAIGYLFTARVAIEAIHDRYDHEYYWGVWAVAVYWHAMSLAWLFVLAVLTVAMGLA